MKHLLLSVLLLAGFAGCKKDEIKFEPAPPLVLGAQINGQAWEADPKSSPYTSVTDTYAYNPVRYVFSIDGTSPSGMPSLNLSRLGFNIYFTYLPKVGRHAINSKSANPKQNYCSAFFYFDAPDKITYRADATSGYVEITEVADRRIKGTFELVCPATKHMPSTSGAPAVFTVTQGRFQGVVSVPNKTLIWDGEQ